MQINTEFYGTDSEQIAIDSRRTALKTPKWTRHGESGVYDGSLYALNKFYNQNASSGTVNLDPSIIPWCINSESVILNRKYAFPYTNSDYNGGTQSTPTDNDYSILASRDWFCDSEDAIVKSANGYQFMIVGYSNIGTNDIDSDNPPDSPPRNTYNQRYSPFDFASQFLDTADSKRTRIICAFDYSDTVTTAKIACVNKDKYENLFNEDDTYKFTSTHYPFKSTDITFYDIQDINNINLNTQLVIGFQVKLYSGYYSSNYKRVYLNIVPFDGYNAIEYNNIPSRKDYTTNLLYGWSGDSPANWFSIGGILYKFNWGKGSGDNLDVYIGKEYANNIYYTKESNESYAFKTVSGDCLNSKFIYKQYPRAQRQMTILFKTYNDLGLDGIRNFIMQQLAYLGFWIVDNDTDAKQKTTKDNHFYLPLFDDNSVTTGQYKRYDEAQDEKNYAWNENIFEQANYTPVSDPNNYDDNTTHLNYIRNIGAPFGHEYIMTQQQVIDLRGDLYSTISSDIDSDIWSQQNFFVNNPMDVIKSLMFFPFDILTATGYAGVATNISLGKIQTTAQGIESPSDIVDVDLGKCTYFPYFGQNDFRNFKPYSSAELFIPYCGTVEIDPELFMNQEISVKMLVDLKTGSCLSLIYRNNMVVDFATGQIGISVPISGIQAQTLASAERQAQSQLKMARISSLTNVANIGLSVGGASMTGGLSLGALPSTISGLMNNYENIENAKYNLEHINTPYKSKGTSTALTSFVNEQQCRLVIKRPVMDEDNLTEYAHNNGYSVLKNDVLNNFTGFTMCDTADLSGINCTKSEKNLIMNHLRNGVYL